MKKKRWIAWILTLIMVLSCGWNLLIPVSAEETKDATSRVEYDYGIEDCHVLPNWRTNFDNKITCKIWDKNHPDGYEKEIEMETVVLANDKGEENDSNIISGLMLDKYHVEEDGEYFLYASEYCNAKLRITHKDALDESKTVTKEFKIVCGKDAWSSEIFTDRGYNQMFSEEDMTLTLGLKHRTSIWNEEDEYYEENEASIDNVDVEWKIEDEEGVVASSQKPQSNPCQFTFTVKDNTDGKNVKIKAYVYALDENGNREEDADGTESVYSYSEITVDIQDSYTVLEPIDVPQTLVGGELNFTSGDNKASYNRYTKGEDPKEESNVTYALTYDENVWKKKNEKDDTLCPVLIRTSKEETEVTLTAYQNTEGESKEIDCRRFTFHELDYDVSYDELMTRDNHDAYFYTNQKEEILTLNTDNLQDKGNWEIAFELGKIVPPDDPEEDGTYEAFKDVDASEYVTYDKEKGKVTFDVQKIYKLIEDKGLIESGFCELRTKVMVGDIEADFRDTSLIFLFGGYKFDLPEEEWILPYWDYDLGSKLSGKKYGADCDENGEDITAPITSVSWKTITGDAEDFRTESEDGKWKICAENYGTLEVTLGYQDPEDSTKTLAYTFTLHVVSEVNRMDEIVSNLGRNTMTTMETMILETNAWTQCYYEEKGHYTDYPNVEYVWTVDEETGPMVELTQDGTRQCEVAVKNGTENYAYGFSNRIICTTYLLDEDGNRAKDEGEDIVFQEREFWVNTERKFDYIDLGENVFGNAKIEVGGNITITPTLKNVNIPDSEDEEEGYSLNSVSETETATKTIEARWDTDVLTVKDSTGKELTLPENDTIELVAGETYTITRKENYETWFNIWGYDEEHEEIAFRNILFTEMDYTIFFDFDNLRDTDYTRIFTDENDYKISVDTRSVADSTTANGLRDGLSITWRLGYWNDDEKFEPIESNLPEGVLIQGTGQNTNTITLDGTKLEKLIKEESGGIGLQAVLMLGENQMSERAVWVELREGEECLEDDETEDTTIGLFLIYENDSIYYYVMDKEHPSGVGYNATIVDITAKNVDSDDDASILTVNHNDGRWEITAERYGRAELTYRISYSDNGETVTKDVVRTKEVAESVYNFSIFKKDYQYEMVPGQTMNLDHTFYRVSYNKTTGKKDVTLMDAHDYSVTYESQNTDIASVDASGKITAKAIGDVVIHATVKMGDIEKTSDSTIYVVDQYNKADVDTIYLEQGESFSEEDLKVGFISYEANNLEGTKLSPERITGVSIVSDQVFDECFAVNKDGTIAARSDYEAEQWPYETAVEIEAELDEEVTYTALCKVVICKHSWKDGKVITKATCTDAGKKEVKCEHCGKTKEVTIKALGHTEVVIPAVPATTKATGLTEGKKCSVCETILVPQKEIPKLTESQEPAQNPSEPAHQHEFSNYVSNNDATVLADGTKTGVCSCGEKNTIADTGSKIKATIQVPAKTFSIQTNQVYKKYTVAMGTGDAIVSVKSSKSNILKITNVNKEKGTFYIKAQKKTGKAVVTITLASGKTQKLTINVQKKAIKTTKISGLKNTYSLKKGKKLTLKPVITPITSKQKITYKTSNKKIATVSSKGVVIGKKKGTAKITVKSGSKKKVVKVIVK